jgi:hypothetical protein
LNAGTGNLNRIVQSELRMSFRVMAKRPKRTTARKIKARRKATKKERKLARQALSSGLGINRVAKLLGLSNGADQR